MFALNRRQTKSLIVLGLIGSAALACGGGDKRFGDDPAPAGGGGAPQSGQLGGGDQGQNGDLGPGNDSKPDPNAQCAAEVMSAQRAEVDIIVVIDTSGSMSEETQQVQQNINNFAQSIGNSGLDYRVIMIAEKNTPPPIPFPFPVPPTGICTPPPLGGANCADNPPRYFHIPETVGSTDSLQIILSTYDSKWKQHLRPTAYKVFIEITDDNSAMDWQTFDSQLLAKAPAGMFGTAQSRKYIFNSICGWQDSTPPLSGQKCGSAVNTGDQYQHLSQVTNGVIDSVCKTSYANVFNNIAKGLVTTLGCEFAVPVPKNGGAVDPTKVVVNYTPGGQTQASALTQVTDASKCGSIPNAWYYDNNTAPTKIIFCQGLCDTAGKDTAGKLEIALGCKAAPPK
jgi:hypothetical protein